MNNFSKRKLKKKKIAQEKEEQKLKQIVETYKLTTTKTEEVVAPVLPTEEVIRRLRARNVPITLFGEDNNARAERLRELELKEPMESLPETLEGSAFQKAMQQEEEDEDVETQKKKKQEEEDPDFKVEQREPTCSEEIILFYFRELVDLMGSRLKSRSEEERKSGQGRMDTTKHKQTKEFIRPFFKMCRNRTLPADILKACMKIVTALKQKNYVEANHSYYRMAIGNDPWPMGVTMVGIHERSAREKIAVSGQAHILNDDIQRKYISAIKRLMTFAQTQNPTKPSMSVM